MNQLDFAFIFGRSMDMGGQGGHPSLYAEQLGPTKRLSAPKLIGPAANTARLPVPR